MDDYHLKRVRAARRHLDEAWAELDRAYHPEPATLQSLARLISDLRAYVALGLEEADRYLNAR